MSRRRSLGVASLVALLAFLVPIPAASAAEVTVNVVNFEFQPREIVLQPGDTVTWTNNDIAPHTATADPGSFESFDLFMDIGQTVSRVFPNGGRIQYFCKFHGAPDGQGMAGVLQIGVPPTPQTIKLTAPENDNVAASIAWSQSLYPTPQQGSAADFALLARDDVFADSLSSGGIQGKLGAPLLLTPGNELGGSVRTELDRLGVHTVYIMGGVEAVFPAVEDALAQEGYEVRRVAGADRLATAVAAAEAFFPETRNAIIARAFGDPTDPTRGFVDSLGAGALAAANNQPLLLSETDRLAETTRAYLSAHPIRTVTVVGGEAALSPQVVTDLEGLGIEVDRAGGADRAETALQVAFRVGGPEGGPPSRVVIVDGADANAWAAGFPAAGGKAPVLLVLGDDVPPATAAVMIEFLDESTGLVCAPFVTDTACSRVEVARAASFEDPENLFGVMTGAVEVPPGDPDGSGGIFLSMPDGSTVCFSSILFEIGEITGAHIHRGAEGVAGEIVVPLNGGPGPFEPGFIGCTFGVDPALLSEIKANPANFYVNIHTTEFPGGAIRDQLFRPSGVFFTDLHGGAEVPAGSGDPDAFGFAFTLATDKPDELCVVMFIEGLDEPANAAHIHPGAVGQEGAPIVDLVPPDPEGGPVHCVTDPDVAAVKANPGGHYINVHTPGFPDGAVRGQLIAPPGPPGA
jgi:putative cell wall-binding protein